ncbi:MAG: hypothetical protein WKF75_21905 [Singulisphaera sp.]
MTTSVIPGGVDRTTGLPEVLAGFLGAMIEAVPNEPRDGPYRVPMKRYVQMGGSLVHSKTFCINSWHSEQYGSHYEVGPDEEGDYEFFSYTSWNELKKYCARFGIPPEVWPDFTHYEGCIDVPLEEIAAKQEPFRRAIESLPAEVIAGNRHLALIDGYVRNGEQVFFC